MFSIFFSCGSIDCCLSNTMDLFFENWTDLGEKALSPTLRLGKKNPATTDGMGKEYPTPKN
jgi:hypothetical protein